MSKQPQAQTAKELGAKKFFAAPSKLSSGAKNRRFGGNKFHNSHLARCTHVGSVYG